MKLYATTTSERATKGQGGNKELRINIKGERIEGIPTRTDLFEIIFIINDNNELEGYVRDYYNDDVINLYPRYCATPPKYKKDVFNRIESTPQDVIDEYNKIKGKQQKGECKICKFTNNIDLDKNGVCGVCRK